MHKCLTATFKIFRDFFDRHGIKEEENDLNALLYAFQGKKKRWSKVGTDLELE